ncbi:hypothetical protein PINS_up018853 [Pythium insidiosum]|nr:hypothetical protein PINS_up018853 [Pythium insidiosum]
MIWAMQEYGRKDKQLLFYWVVWISRWLTFISFIYICIWPPPRASARAFRQSLVFYFIVQCLYFTACEVFHRGGSVGLGTKFGFVSAVWVGLCSFVIWREFKADTEHWRERQSWAAL